MIYFIQSGEDGPIKIGLAYNPRARLAELQTANPTKLRLLTTTEGELEQEQWLHRRFRNGRIHSEWFRYDTPGLQEYISAAQARSLEPLETSWEISGTGTQICDYCLTEEVLPPRRRFCSDDCAQLMRRERQEAAR